RACPPRRCPSEGRAASSRARSSRGRRSNPVRCLGPGARFPRYPRRKLDKLVTDSLQTVDLVVQGQEALPRQGEAVVRLQLAVGDVDVDALVEGEELDHGEGVALAVDRAQVVPREREVGARAEHEVVLALV